MEDPRLHIADGGLIQRARLRAPGTRGDPEGSGGDELALVVEDRDVDVSGGHGGLARHRRVRLARGDHEGVVVDAGRLAHAGRAGEAEMLHVVARVLRRVVDVVGRRIRRGGEVGGAGHVTHDRSPSLPSLTEVSACVE